MQTDPLKWRTTTVLAISSIDGGNSDTRTGGSAPLVTYKCSVSSGHVLTVSGTGYTQGFLTCTLSRLGKNPGEDRDTIWSATRIVNKPRLDGSGNWSVQIPVQDKATHLLLCHSSKEGNVYAEVVITDVAAFLPGSERGRLVFTTPPPSFGSSLVTANGSVLNADNPVNCSLTPIACDTGAQSGKPYIQPASWTDADHTMWTVSFVGRFRGCYLLEAMAASEGTISVSGSV
jgi:hypothetical protein